VKKGMKKRNIKSLIRGVMPSCDLFEAILHFCCQVWQEGHTADGDILRGECRLDISDFAYPRRRKPTHSQASGLGEENGGMLVFLFQL
jgi:hypothetical protein